MLARTVPLPAVHVAAGDAIGRALAEDVSSPIDLPPFDNSAMDGFALRGVDTAGAVVDAPVRLRLVGESRAGSPAAASLEPGCAMRISTGAAMPAGADAVVRVEDAVVDGDVLLLTAELEAGHDVRPAGDDVKRGEIVIAGGTTVRAGELAMLASTGTVEVAVHERARVALVATGDELVPPGEQLGPGQIYDSNSQMLAQLLRETGADLATIETRVADDRATVDAVLSAALNSEPADLDALVICGGVSMGEHDHVKAALASAGVERIFWQVALRPGHPTWFGVRTAANGHQTLVFGLPGNPVSAFVTFHMFVRPALAALGGDLRPPLTLRARFHGPAQRKKSGFSQVLRCRLSDGDGEAIATLTGANQRSHAVSSTVGADALIVLPAAAENLADGDIVTVRLLRN